VLKATRATIGGARCRFAPPVPCFSAAPARRRCIAVVDRGARESRRNIAMHIARASFFKHRQRARNRSRADVQRKRFFSRVTYRTYCVAHTH